MSDPIPPGVEVVVRPMEFGSPDYQTAVALRYAVLRAPLGLEWSQAELDDEPRCFHFCGFAEARLIATLLLKPIDRRTVKMRQVTVHPAWQGKGAGAAMVGFAEVFARERGFDRVTAHARSTAMDFYTRLGYSVVGEPFIENTIPHILVVKELASGSPPAVRDSPPSRAGHSASPPL